MPLIKIPPTLLRLKRRIFHHVRFVRMATVVGCLLVIFACLAVALHPFAPQIFSWFSLPLKTATEIFRAPAEIKNSQGRTNILLLGIGGANHDGPDLTDTIIVASVITKLDDKSKIIPPVVLTSIPRDIYLESLQNKINSAYSIGKESGAGLTLTKGAVSEITGLPIHYAVSVDFSAFEKVIDILGGLDINVVATFDDYYYPINGKETDSCGFTPQEIASKIAAVSDDISAAAAFPCRYEHLHFEAGQQHMDGATALKFVRSRHAEGDEGSDFARSARQQLVIKAIAVKIFSAQLALNPQKALAIYDQLKTHVDTDFSPEEFKGVSNLVMEYRQATFSNVAIDLNLLDNPPIDYRGWILLPKGGNWDQVHEFIKNALEKQQPGSNTPNS